MARKSKELHSANGTEENALHGAAPTHETPKSVNSRHQYEHEPRKGRSISREPDLDAANTVKRQRFEDRNITTLPEEVLLLIFSNLLEQDLCVVAQVCWSFYRIANDATLWKRLYKEVYEYDLPLLVGSDPRDFYFVPMSANDICQKWKAKSSRGSTDVFPGMQMQPWIEEEVSGDEEQPEGSPASTSSSVLTFGSWSVDSAGSSPDASPKQNPHIPENLLAAEVWTEEEEASDGEKQQDSNRWSPVPSEETYVYQEYAWKQSFMQLYRAVHVRPGYEVQNGQAGRKIRYFGNVQDALHWCEKDRAHANDTPLIFIHSGIYRKEAVDVVTPVFILGCGPGPNPAKTVKFILNSDESYFDFVKNSGSSYLGYVTVITRNTEHSKRNEEFWYCIMAKSNTIIDHCVIQSSKGTGVYVDSHAEPRVRCCDISNCRGGGIFITVKGGGRYEKNIFSKIGLSGISYRQSARPNIRRNTYIECSKETSVYRDDHLL